MTSPNEGAPRAGHYECTFEFQPGWIDLTLQEGTKAEAKALATEVVNRLNPLGLGIEKSAVFDDMAERAVDLNEEFPTLAAAYYTEAPHRGPHRPGRRRNRVRTAEQFASGQDPDRSSLLVSFPAPDEWPRTSDAEELAEHLAGSGSGSGIGAGAEVGVVPLPAAGRAQLLNPRTTRWPTRW